MTIWMFRNRVSVVMQSVNEILANDGLTPEQITQMTEDAINEHLLDELDMWVDITCVGDSHRRSMHLATGAIREEPPEVYHLP